MRLLLFLMTVASPVVLHAQGIQMNNVLECYGNPSAKNLASQIRFKTNHDSAILNWKREMWLLKFEDTILNEKGDYAHRYKGHLLSLLITGHDVTILDAKSGSTLFSDSLNRCKSVEYVSY
jgi:hypothetical protein